MVGNATWFEIPTNDFERAVKFYEAVFQVKMKRENIGGDMAIFPGDDNAVSGALVAPHPDYAPSATGAAIYLNAGNDLQPLLDRAAKNGGSVMVPKTALPPGMGFFAHLKDSEGNRVGLHSMN
ncbi:MAG: VOC family protein [Betaproteobacteria bacterium]|nr:MAG: VOC family protein [Betaproteobacteria bacterium]